MFEILRKSFDTGVVTEPYPPASRQAGSGLSSFARGRPEIDFANWRDARPAVAACPTAALACRDTNATRIVTLDLGKCTFCGLCAGADTTIKMSSAREFAACTRADLRPPPRPS